MLEGTAHIIKEDFWGNRVILGPSGPGQLFAESYACLGSENLAVSVVAATTARVMFLDVVSLFQSCTTACDFHTRMIRNLTRVLAGRNLMLTQKVEHMAQKTTREKLLSYLSGEAQRAGSASFSIPYDRQELADYLSVDRSAMCTELSKLQRQGFCAARKSSLNCWSCPGNSDCSQGRNANENKRMQPLSAQLGICAGRRTPCVRRPGICIWFPRPLRRAAVLHERLCVLVRPGRGSDRLAF